MKTTGKVILIILAFGLIFGVCTAMRTGCSMFEEAADVTKEEFGPRATLAKYEWFKDQAAALDSRIADIDVLMVLNNKMLNDYNGDVSAMSRDERQEYRQRQAELAGLKLSFNRMAAAYNAQMAKFNWRFANKGDLPQGASEPLPRRYKPYVTQ